MSDETRVLVGQPASILWNWRLGSTSTAPSDPPTRVGVFRPDGTALPGAPATAAATGNVAEPGEVSFLLPTQAECTLLRVTWTATVGGQLRGLTSWVEVVGEHLFDLADLRAFEWGGFTQGAAPLADTAKYPDAKLLRLRDQIADEIEEWTGTSPMERYTSAILRPSGASKRLALETPGYHPRRVLSLKNGTAVWGSNLIAELVLGISIIEHPYRTFADPVAIEYVRGLARVPTTIAEAAMKLAIFKARPSQIPARAISLTDERGTMQLSVPNYERRRYYGVPDIDVALQTIDDSILSSV